MTTYFYHHIPIFKALSDETRLKIVQMLTCQPLCANEILECFRMTQPSLSYHMKILTVCGLVNAKRKSGFTIYEVNKEALDQVIALLNEFAGGIGL